MGNGHLYLFRKPGKSWLSVGTSGEAASRKEVGGTHDPRHRGYEFSHTNSTLVGKL